MRSAVEGLLADQAQACRGGGRGLARRIEEAGDFRAAAVDDGDDHLADLVPTSHAPIPNVAAVDSNRFPAAFPPGSSRHRSARIFPSIVVHIWQMT